MNKENAKEFLPLVQALADGKTIQMRDVVSEKVTLWDDLDPSDIHFCQHPEEYRIKPEPRTWEVWAHKNDKDIIASIPSTWITDDTWKRITVQEVLE